MGYDAKETTQYEQVEGDFEMHALYMPYLFWDKEPGHTEPTFERKPSSPRASREDMSHYFATVEPRDHEVSNPVKTSEVLGTSVEPETSPQFQVTLTQGIDLVENIGSNIQEKIEQETDYGSVEVEGESQIREKAKADAKNFIHKPLTLDQYYYASLRDTLARDQDQVLGRYFRMLGADTGKTNPQDEGQQELNYGKAPNLPLENKQQLEDSSDKNLKAAPAQILMVNQLWLWILHDGVPIQFPSSMLCLSYYFLTQYNLDTIITSTTTQPRNFKTTFLQRVLDLLQEQNGRSKLTALQIADLAMNTATGFFDAQEIVIYEEQAQPQDEDYDDDQSEEDKVNWSEHKSPLDIFRESIQNIRDNEATLFTLFKDSIESPDGSKIMKHSMSPKGVSGNNRRFTIATRSHRFHERIWGILKQCWRSLSQPIEDNPYEDIVQETKLLNEVKDILDELNILKKLSQDQEHVRSLWTDHVDTSGFNPLVTPNERTKEIESMSEDAKSVQDDIKTLLDLKQKEATIIEAQATRRQSDSVMVFTVVTVVFVSLTFVCMWQQKQPINLSILAACFLPGKSFCFGRGRISPRG
ncbi:hypothetical protein N7456_004704 [Penicillium angulare]|uniref:Mg2+ transporter protein, CorA-like/Zinc transport protein ZntB n=1 Tax=Penicillium angulare TaxID=116970 RepID=A0A9W9KIM2_9EURO|nr:hypothetical protein N7456_004704 [Penicillium angulare]